MKTLVSISVFLLMLTCATNNKEKEVLSHAASIHNEMMKTLDELEAQIAALEKDTTKSTLADSLTAWKEAIELWESGFVEVPGNEEHHHHKEGGHHHHNHETVEVTAEQMLSIQQELSTRLAGIKSRIKATI